MFLGLGTLFYIKIDNLKPKNASVLDNHIEEKALLCIKKLEDEAWQQLKQLDITPEILSNTMSKYHDEYFQGSDTINKRDIATSIIELVETILSEFNINPQDIAIIPFNDRSPAASNEKVIFINEEEFNKRSKAAQYFIIGHEAQHIIRQDCFKNFVIEKLLEHNSHPQKQDMFNAYLRLTEKIADVKTASKSSLWAERYVAYTQESLDLFGDTPGISHPKVSERLKMAKNILNNNYQIA
jgi:hypothetical protein